MVDYDSATHRAQGDRQGKTAQEDLWPAMSIYFTCSAATSAAGEDEGEEEQGNCKQKVKEKEKLEMVQTHTHTLFRRVALCLVG